MSMEGKTVSTVEKGRSFYFRLSPEEDKRKKERDIPAEEQSVDEGKSLSSRIICEHSGGKLNFSRRRLQV